MLLCLKAPVNRALQFANGIILYSYLIFTGYYTHISTLADVQENVMEYLHVLSRPMVINHDHDIIWTEAYMDSVVSVWFWLFRRTEIENSHFINSHYSFPTVLISRHFNVICCADSVLMGFFLIIISVIQLPNTKEVTLRNRKTHTTVL